MGITKMLKKILSIRQRSKTSQVEVSADRSKADDFSSMKIPVELEVDLIKTLLERKFSRKFQMRVKVEGYLGEEMKYRLVVDDYCANDQHHKYHSVYGYDTSNILDVKREFLKSYWDQVQKVHDSVGKTLDKWDSDRIAEYKDTMVASSREELLIHADLEGLK
jgi:hypothetical protein